MLLLTTIIASFLFSTAARLLVERILLEPLPILGPAVVLRLHENAGIAFGIHLPLTVFIPLVVVAILFLSVAAISQRGEILLSVGHGLILGGALANLLDRLDDGMVTDFFAVSSFPIFNLADSSITIGVAAIFLSFILSSRRRRGDGAAGYPVPR